MKKLLNVRAAVVLAFAIGAGAGFAYLSAYYSVPLWWMVAIIPVTAAFIVLFIIRRSTVGIVVAVLSALLFLYGALGVVFRLRSYTDTPLPDSAVCRIRGTVFEKSRTQSGEYIKLSGIIADGVPVGGCMTVYLGEDYGEYAEVGYDVEFSGVVYVYEPFGYGEVNSERLLQDIRYSASPVDGLESEYGFSLFGSINSAVRELYFGNLSPDTAAIVYAMYTGNTDYIETSTMDSFRYGGVAHVFAVSGMHIVLVYGAVSFVLRRLRLGKLPAAAISVLLVFFYTGMCGFTLSAVRAAIMCAVAAAVRLACGKYDALASVALAFVAVLLVNPLNIISVGFQLSVAAVAGIALFCAPVTRALKRIRLPGVIAAAAAMTLSSQIATFPILLSCFGYVSWASLALNIIFVPVLSAIFTVQFAFTLLAFVIPPLAQLLISAFAVPTEAVTAALVTIRAERALISGFTFGAFAVPYFLAVYVVSGHVNIKVRFRVLVAGVLAAVVASGIGLANYIPPGGVRVTASAREGSAAVLLSTRSGSVLVLSEEPSAYDISGLVGENGGGNLSAMIILGGYESVLAYTRSGVECSDVYVWQDNLHFQPYSGVTVHYERTFSAAGIEFEYCGSHDLGAYAGGISIGISCGENVMLESCDLLFAAAESRACEYGTAVYFSKVNSQLNLYDCGDLQFVAKDGKMYSIGNISRKGALL